MPGLQPLAPSSQAQQIPRDRSLVALPAPRAAASDRQAAHPVEWRGRELPRGLIVDILV
ncbi:MAG TPA: hypothetical protein VFA12_00740 [Stellaceae bacterium]|nr:hypothetical protein [Stellaceae bacterium]